MASFESEASRVIDKFNGENFNFWKFKIEMLLAFMDLWDIVDISEEALPSNADSKVLKEYQIHIKNPMFIIALNLADNQLAYIKSYKQFAEACKTLHNILETKSLSNILFSRCKFFMCKMQEDNNLLDHVNKVKAFVEQFCYLEVSVRDEDIIMTLLKSLLASHKYFITTLETIPMKKLMIDYVAAHLMHEMSKPKKKEPQGKDVVIILRQSKCNNSFLRQCTKSCFYCGELGHIAHFCFKTNNKKRKM